ncbi:MAG TPA: hypothetical protein VMB80_01445 [Candidatus Acidoferrum sp.]|nr:hypothetical protein [Candidatus Acidoferrum sp.]
MNAAIRYLCLVAGAVLLSARLPAQPVLPALNDDTRAYFDALRSEFNTNKVAVISQVLNLTPAEADKFWPIYRAYEKELAVIGDRKLELAREFASDYNHNTFTDETAKVLAEKWLRNLEDHTKLWKKYHRRISRSVSPMRAAQFLQIENQIAIYIDLAIASNLPSLAPGSPSKSQTK